MFNSVVNFCSNVAKAAWDGVKRVASVAKAVITSPATVATGALALVATSARADTSDPTAPMISTATTYFGYITTALGVIGGLVLGVAIVAAVISMVTTWLHRGHK